MNIDNLVMMVIDDAEGNHEEALDLLCNQKYLSDMGLLDNDNTNIIQQAYNKIKKAIETSNKIVVKPNKYVQEAIEEALRISNDPNEKSFSTTEEFFEDLKYKTGEKHGRHDHSEKRKI
jgi:CRISPR/Cas system CMR subunit Cmr6 (Cas7 group RAMP superfamily)